MILSDCLISVVVPVSNEEAEIGAFLRRLSAVLASHYEHHEIVVVDDGSTDATAQVVTDLMKEVGFIRLLRLSRRWGRETAIHAGLETVIGDFVVTMLPISDPPEAIPTMVDMARGRGGIVIGVRSSSRRESLLTSLGSRIFYWIAVRILDLKIPQNSTHFRVFTRQAVNAVLQIKEKFRYLKVSSAYVGFQSQTFAYQPILRADRRQAMSFTESVELAINATVASSTRLLRIVTWVGLLAGFLDVLYMGYIVAIAIFKEQVAEGWITLSAQQAGMFLFVFIILTVLGEYIGRILAESQDRPPYFVMEEKSSSVLLANDRRNVVSAEAQPVGDE